MPKNAPRRRRTRAEWTRIFRRFESSDLTIREFCHREGLALSSFQRWRSRLGPVGPGEFVELVPTVAEVTPGADWSLEIALPNGARLRFRS